jgi:hypothetical protein
MFECWLYLFIMDPNVWCACRGGPKAKAGGMNVPPNFSKIALKYAYL